jgi:hypothetical protein
MGRRADITFTVVSLVAVVFLLTNWFSLVPLIVPQTVQWELVVSPNCNGNPAEKYVPGGEDLVVQYNTTAPFGSPGAVWINGSGPGGGASYYVEYADGWQHPSGALIFSNTMGGEYSFTACAVDGAPDTPVFLNGSYVLSPVF